MEHEYVLYLYFKLKFRSLICLSRTKKQRERDFFFGWYMANVILLLLLSFLSLEKNTGKSVDHD